MMYVCVLQGFMLLCGCGRQRSTLEQLPSHLCALWEEVPRLTQQCLPIKPQFISFWCLFFFPIWILVFRYLRILEISLSHTTIILSSFLFFLPSLSPSIPPSFPPSQNPSSFPSTLSPLPVPPTCLPPSSFWLFSPSWNYKRHVLDLLYLFYLTPFW